MNKTFQSFVFGCRVNEAERIRMDRELVEMGFSVDLASPSFLIINTCAITGKAEREAQQLINRLKREHPQAKIVLTGCSATLWNKYQSKQRKLVDLVVPNNQKSTLVSLLHTSEVCKATSVTCAPSTTAAGAGPSSDKFRHSNRLLVKIQDGCHRFCSYCIVPYLRGLPKSERISHILAYINSFSPTPSEVVLSAINTESFGKDTGESLINLIRQVLANTNSPRVALGSLHPWSLNKEFIAYYQSTLSHEKRFVNFFHVPLQSGTQEILKYMKREYDIKDVVSHLELIHHIHPNALIATDIIVGFLGETDELFEATYQLLIKSPISRLHVFRFSNRPHTAAYYLKNQLREPTAKEKMERSKRLIALSKKKYRSFIESQRDRSALALVIAKYKDGIKVLLDNQCDGFIPFNNSLPGQIVHVTIIAVKDRLLICKES